METRKSLRVKHSDIPTCSERSSGKISREKHRAGAVVRPYGYVRIMIGAVDKPEHKMNIGSSLDCGLVEDITDAYLGTGAETNRSGSAEESPPKGGIKCVFWCTRVWDGGQDSVLPKQLFPPAHAVRDREGFFSTVEQAPGGPVNVDGFSSHRAADAVIVLGVEIDTQPQSARRTRRPLADERRFIRAGRRCPTQAGEQILPERPRIDRPPRTVSAGGVCNCYGHSGRAGDLRFPATRRRWH